MGWLKNILKGSSSSSKSKFKEEDHGSKGVLEDVSSSTEENDVDNGVIEGHSYSYDDHQYFENQNTIYDYHEYKYAMTPVWDSQENVDHAHILSGGEDDPPQQYDAITNFMPNPSDSYEIWGEYGNNGLNIERFQEYDHAFQNLQESYESSSSSPEIADYKFAEIDQWSHIRPSWNPYSIICDVCEEPVPLDSKGIPQYKDIPIFHQKYCIKHRDDGTALCFFCERLEPRKNRYSSYADGRKICKDCKKSAIMDKRDSKPLLEEILNFYEDLDMKVMQENISIVMLDQKGMNEGYRGSGYVRGTTKSEEHCAMKTMIETPMLGHNGKVIGIKERPFKLSSHRHVREIRLLNGCPRLYIGRTLAHEMMHAWLHLEGYHMYGSYESFCGPMGKDIEEGVCQVLAHMWIKSKIHAIPRDETSSSPEQQFERKLARHIRRSIENSRDPIYGDGFRLAHKVVKKHGLKGMLNYVRMIGSFPA